MKKLYAERFSLNIHIRKKILRLYSIHRNESSTSRIPDEDRYNLVTIEDLPISDVSVVAGEEKPNVDCKILILRNCEL